ncbi:flavin reductase family protein, partial [Aduncisulcus paluster]
SDVVDAPYVDEFPFIFECKVVETVELGLHTQFVGEIVSIKADDSILDEKGKPVINKVNPFIYDPNSREYRGIGDIYGHGFNIGKKIME